MNNNMKQTMPTPKPAAVRYEIRCSKRGAMIVPDAPVLCIVAGGEKAVVIVTIEARHRAAFEKSVEGNPLVTGYRADPDAGETEVWSR